MKRPAMLTRKTEKDNALWAVCYAVLLFAMLFIAGKLWVTANYVVVQVQGPSMLDTLYGGREVGQHIYVGGDYLYVRRTSEAERGDIIIVDVSGNPSFSDDKIIKRLIAKEGDSIYAEDGVVYLKKAGEQTYTPLEEDYVKPDPSYKIKFGEVVLGEDEIFVMGDNREISADSRILPSSLTEDEIFGVVCGWNLQPASGWAAAEAFFVRTFLAVDPN